MRRDNIKDGAPPPQKKQDSVYHKCTLYTTYARCLQNVQVHSVYKLCTVSTNCAQCLHVCTVSADYTQVNVYVHRVYKFQHRVYMYACIRIYAYMYTQTPYLEMVLVFTYVYAPIRVYACAHIRKYLHPAFPLDTADVTFAAGIVGAGGNGGRSALGF